MQKKISKLLLTLLSLCWLLPAGASNIHTIEFSFYSKEVSLKYDQSILFNMFVYSDEKTCMDFFNTMEKSNFGILLQELNDKKAEWQLNDMLFYELMRSSIKKIYRYRGDNFKTLANWFFMAKAGFDTRLTYRNSQIFLYVAVDEEIFEAPLIEMEGKQFVNLTYFDFPRHNIDGVFYVVDKLPVKGGRSFSFHLKELPKFETDLREQVISFKYDGNVYKIPVDYDAALVRLMRKYPTFSEKYYLEVPLSDVASKSLVKNFKRITRDKTELQTLEMILTFTRSAFSYKEDNAAHGKNKPMIAEEVLHYKYSDCEDRSALFYNLAKELLGLPMIIVAYSNHLTIGMALDENVGPPLHYKGRKYTICDPTGPTNSPKAGIYPEGYENQTYQVIGSFN